MTAFPIVKEGWPFIGVMICVTAFVAVVVNGYWAILPAVVCCFFTYFFRNPPRKVEYNPFHLLSPADGKVMSITDVHEDEYLGEDGKKVTIFLSPFDVHVNRSPMEGTIKFQQYVCGRFRPAYKAIAAWENERHAIGIESEHCRILVTQVAGILARRVVSWVTLGTDLQQGQLYGMIKFGSCTEIIVPNNVDILVRQGQRVRAGVTIIGRISS
jgi:phosphatidylserine decarboxylase